MKRSGNIISGTSSSTENVKNEELDVLFIGSMHGKNEPTEEGRKEGTL